MIIGPTITLTQDQNTLEVAPSDIKLGKVALGAIEGNGSGGQSFSIVADFGAEVTVGEIGENVSLGALSFQGGQAISIQGIKASSLEVVTGEGALSFNGNVSLTGEATIQAGNIGIGGIIIAENLSLNALGPIFSLGSETSIAATSASANVLLNSERGGIGASNAPIQIEQTDLLTLGAKGDVFLSGNITIQAVDYVQGNEPCLVTINGSRTNNCSRSLRKHFLRLPKTAFEVFFFNPERLGIGFSPICGQVHKLSSHFLQLYLSQKPQQVPPGFLPFKNDI